jgi:hypothetical protein
MSIITLSVNQRFCLIPVITGLMLMGLADAGVTAPVRTTPVEKRILKVLATEHLNAIQRDRHCDRKDRYVVCLIDNFVQPVRIVREVSTSHGEMVLRLLQSGREDIEVRVLNTSLSRGLALIIADVLQGHCVDAVISSTPGSNYTYAQTSSLLLEPTRLGPDNILAYRDSLLGLLKDIAFNGFPSVEWYVQVDVNATKLRNDARKLTFIEALGQFDIPVFLPYGNSDSVYKGQARSINILSLASNVKAFSALDEDGQRIPGFPYSPLSTGDRRAVFEIIECPDPANPSRARLDINDDGFFDYTFTKDDFIAYQDSQGRQRFAPPPLSSDAFESLLGRIAASGDCRIDRQMVLTGIQYRQLAERCSLLQEMKWLKSYVWLNSSRYGPFFSFDARCWQRGRISGTSLIPPAMVKKWLPAPAD